MQQVVRHGSAIAALFDLRMFWSGLTSWGWSAGHSPEFPNCFAILHDGLELHSQHPRISSVFLPVVNLSDPHQRHQPHSKAGVFTNSEEGFSSAHPGFSDLGSTGNTRRLI
jgi:hypothetical protein